MATQMEIAPDAAVLPQEISDRIVSSKAYGLWDEIHDDLAWIRANAPLAIAKPRGFDPFWMVSKHADIKEIGRQPQIFNNADMRYPYSRTALISQTAAEALVREAEASGGATSVHSIVGMDPPQHGVYRKLTFRDFAPKGIKVLEDQIRELAAESMGELAATGGRCDFAKEIAMPYPMRVILSLLGLPRSDEEMMLKLTQEYFNPQDPELNQTGAETDESNAQPSAHETLRAYFEFFNELTEDRRRSPREDIASTIANAVIDGEPINNWIATSYYITILTAGHDTTSSSTAAGVWALAENPEIFRQVAEDRSLIPALVEESIRWATPLIHFMRTATQDYTLRGQEIRKGDWLMLNYVSGNDDEEVFDNPREFRLDRQNNQQISFGFGAHVCLGQHLARMEMKIFFEHFFNTVASLEMAGPGKRNHSMFVGGIKSVPINFTLKV